MTTTVAPVDDLIVGAGIVGLALARAAASRGRRVLMLDRAERAQGASIRNFGMLWPIGQPDGPVRALADRSLALWHAVLAEAGLWHDRCGSLHLAYRDDEAQVLAEFAGRTTGPVEWLDRDAVLKRSPFVRRAGLIGGLFSPVETCVDPRKTVAALPGFLAERYGVRFRFGTPVLAVTADGVQTTAGPIAARRVFLAPGADLRTLCAERFAAEGVRPCKLQMLRSAPLPGGDRLGPMLAAGLTLRHYRSFEGCPTLPALRARVAAESPAFDRHGIHVMASQWADGRLVLGDSHEYGDAITPFDSSEIDDLILGYLETFLDVPGLQITERWNGTYAKHPGAPFVIDRPAPNVAAVLALGGAGMTLSFGLTERVEAETPES